MNLREKLIEENCRGRYTQEMSKKELVNFIFDYFEAQQKPKALAVQVPKKSWITMADLGLVTICKNYPNINTEALNEWLDYKKYRNQIGVTKTLKMMEKYDFQSQQEMVDVSIGNEYKGLFPLKNKRSNTDKNISVAQSWLEDNTDINYIGGDC